MPNSITLPVQYLQALDLIYKAGALTSILDNTDAQVVGKEFKIKKVTTQGPAPMTRGNAFIAGDVTVGWQSVTPDYDRGRKFTIDALDELELGGLFMDVAAEFTRVHSIPEIDAYRFAKIASTASILKVNTPATIADATAFIAAVNAAMGEMDSNEVPMEGRILYAEASLLRAVQALDTTKSRETLAAFARVIPVPQARFYTAITFNDGVSEGQTAGGFIKTVSTGKDINFLIVHPTAMEQAIKRTVTPVDAPDADYDAYRVSNRVYGYCAVKDNKVKGIYLHHKA